ncbi:hypothetical protein BJ912DRAFT_1068585 [Pholiota molesta]|nr:hypothetical protein BJ912DRAFT_1068585 [Pholiota molesta]
MEQRNQQQHQATQLQLTAVTLSLNSVTRAIDGLETRVVNTQRAILAQSREISLSRNVTDTGVNILTLEMNIMLEKNPERKKALEDMLETMKVQKAKIQATIEDASNDFMAIVSHPVPQLTQPMTDANPTAPPGIPQPVPRPSTNHRRVSGTSIAGADDSENNPLKRQRVDSEHVLDSQDEEMVSSIPENPRKYENVFYPWNTRHSAKFIANNKRSSTYDIDINILGIRAQC